MADSAARSTAYKWVSAKGYDLTETPEKQGFAVGTFDIIISFNALHVTDIPSTLASLQRLLVPGGSLLVAELDGTSWAEKAGSLWADTVFGTLPGWYNSLLTADQWNSSLLSAGYLDVQTSTDSSSGLELIFLAQTPEFTPAAAPTTRPTDAVFVPFVYGKEMEMQAELAKYDINNSLSVWLLAESGIDSDAAIGLIRCMIIEMVTWKVHLAIFDGITDQSKQIDAILQYRQFIEEEDIIRFTNDASEPQIPKLALLNPPAPAVEFNPAGTWTVEGSEIVQTALPPLADSEVSVEISSWSDAVGSFRGFTGTVIESADESFSAGQKVVGISEHVLSNKIVSHTGPLAVIPQENESLAGDALAVLIGTLSLGPKMTSRSKRSPSSTVLITEDGTLGKSLSKFLAGIPYISRVELGQPSLDSSDTTFDVIITDAETLNTKPEIAPMGKKLFVWDTILREMIETDPFSIGYALEVGFGLTKASTGGAIIRPLDLIKDKVGSLVSTKVPLFSAEKAYILIGGMSDVGIYTSTWMYKVRQTLHPRSFQY